MSWISSFSKMTAPGVNAMLPPTSNAFSSVIEISAFADIFNQVSNAGRQTVSARFQGKPQ